MDASTRGRLNELNRRFYSRYAASFDATRREPWRGWERIVSRLPRLETPTLLDVGCGNGRFGAYLASRADGGIDYTGVDASSELIDRARRRAPADWSFLEVDVVLEGLGQVARSFDLVACFGLLHHVAGESTRRRLIGEMAARVAPGGRLAVSFWRFAEDERAGRRLRSAAALDVGPLEPGDYLMPWGDGGEAVRYCHHADEAEIERLLSGIGLESIDAFRADGRSGELNDYRLLGR